MLEQSRIEQVVLADLKLACRFGNLAGVGTDDQRIESAIL